MEDFKKEASIFPKYMGEKLFVLGRNKATKLQLARSVDKIFGNIYEWFSLSNCFKNSKSHSGFVSTLICNLHQQLGSFTLSKGYII